MKWWLKYYINFYILRKFTLLLQMGTGRSLWETYYLDESMKNEANEDFVEMENTENPGANEKVVISKEDFYRLLHSICQ